MASAPESARNTATWNVKECFDTARLIQRKLRRVCTEKRGPNKTVTAEKFVLAGFPALYKCKLKNDNPLRAMFETIRLTRELTPIIFHIPPWVEDHAAWQSIQKSDEFHEASTIFPKPLSGWELHRCARETSYGDGGPYGWVENWEAIAVDQLRFGSTLPEHEHNGRFAALMVTRWALDAGSHELLLPRGRPGHASIREALLAAMNHVLDDDAERQALRQFWSAHLSSAELRRAAQWEHALPRSGPAADLAQLVSAYEVLGGHLTQLFQAMSVQRSLAKRAYEPVSRQQATSFM
ncbi:hypothetical protein JCM8208_005791 [Rhodotorula glutinis]